MNQTKNFQALLRVSLIAIFCLLVVGKTQAEEIYRKWSHEASADAGRNIETSEVGYHAFEKFKQPGNQKSLRDLVAHEMAEMGIDRYTNDEMIRVYNTALALAENTENEGELLDHQHSQQILEVLQDLGFDGKSFLNLENELRAADSPEKLRSLLDQASTENLRQLALVGCHLLKNVATGDPEYQSWLIQKLSSLVTPAQLFYFISDHNRRSDGDKINFLFNLFGQLNGKDHSQLICMMFDEFDSEMSDDDSEDDEIAHALQAQSEKVVELFDSAKKFTKAKCGDTKLAKIVEKEEKRYALYIANYASKASKRGTTKPRAPIKSKTIISENICSQDEMKAYFREVFGIYKKNTAYIGSKNDSYRCTMAVLIQPTLARGSKQQHTQDDPVLFSAMLTSKSGLQKNFRQCKTIAELKEIYKAEPGH